MLAAGRLAGCDPSPPCCRDVRRHGGRGRSNPRRLRSGWRTRRRGRVAPAVPWHHRQCVGASMCAGHRRMEAAEAVATAADTVTAVGAGWTTHRAIAEALNARGIRTGRGGAWHASTVRNLLRRSRLGLKVRCGRIFEGERTDNRVAYVLDGLAMGTANVVVAPHRPELGTEPTEFINGRFYRHPSLPPRMRVEMSASEILGEAAG